MLPFIVFTLKFDFSYKQMGVWFTIFVSPMDSLPLLYIYRMAMHFFRKAVIYSTHTMLLILHGKLEHVAHV